MALTSAYINAADYRARKDVKSSADDEVLDIDLLAISRFIEARTGRMFNQDSAVAWQFIVGGRFASLAENGRVLYLPDFGVDPTSIIIDENDDGAYTSPDAALLVADYELLPLNALLGPEPQPFTSIRLTPWGDKTIWPIGIHVQVTAQWGWPAIPESVKRATADIASVLRIEDIRATNRIQEGVDTAIAASVDAQNIIWKLIDVYSRKTYA